MAQEPGCLGSERGGETCTKWRSGGKHTADGEDDEGEEEQEDDDNNDDDVEALLTQADGERKRD